MKPSLYDLLNGLGALINQTLNGTAAEQEERGGGPEFAFVIFAVENSDSTKPIRFYSNIPEAGLEVLLRTVLDKRAVWGTGERPLPAPTTGEVGHG